MDAVEEIKGRLSIEDVVSEYVQLKRAGRNFKGLSPFTNEKTPSFIVSPDKQIWHDFSSGSGGDMFSFLMAVEGVEFKDALEQLARKAGVNLEDYQRPGQSKGPDKAQLRQLTDASTRFYQRQFAANNLAMTYVFKTRQFTKQTALDWQLGYAPNTGDALLNYLKKLGYNDKQLKLAGVTGRSGRDMFRQRLMVPLADGQGQVIGFTARLLGEADGNSPKYINTPATPLYDKSRHVFGLHHAKAAIRQAKFAVLVEGNLDVIMSHQAGVKNVVATAGTALTEFQLKTLGRLTGDIRLCFDADRAGLDATERAIPLASKAKVSLSVITIPSGKDPDELIKQDAKKWTEIIQQPVYALDWLITRYQNLFDLTTAEGKRKFTDKILEVIKTLSDPVEQDHYLGQLAELLDASKQALADKMAAGTATPKPLKRAKLVQNIPDKAQLEYQKQQDHFLAIALMQPKTRQYLDLVRSDMFSQAWQKQLLEFLNNNPDFTGEPTQAKQLSEIAQNVKIISLQFEELYQGLDPQDLAEEAVRLRARLVEAYVKHQKHQLVQKMDSASDTENEQLLIKVKELDNLLRQATIRRS